MSLVSDIASFHPIQGHVHILHSLLLHKAQNIDIRMSVESKNTRTYNEISDSFASDPRIPVNQVR